MNRGESNRLLRKGGGGQGEGVHEDREGFRREPGIPEEHWRSLPGSKVGKAPPSERANNIRKGLGGLKRTGKVFRKM